MEHLKTIVVGFDFSPQSRTALAAAIRIARLGDASIILTTSLQGHIDKDVLDSLHAQASAGGAHADLYDTENLISSTESRIRAELQPVPFGDVGWKVEVGLVKPWAHLVEVADTYEADLIVVGATGLGAVDRFLVGSTSERLVRASRWPVLVVKEDRPLLNILCPIDFSDAARAAVRWGGMIARTTHSTLHIMHAVVTEPTFTTPQYFDYNTYRTAAVEHAEKQYTAFLEDLDLEGVTVERHLRTSSAGALPSALPDSLIVAAAIDFDADLICMGSIGRTGLRALLIGNTAERVLRRLPCSLLTVKPDDFSLK